MHEGACIHLEEWVRQLSGKLCGELLHVQKCRELFTGCCRLSGGDFPLSACVAAADVARAVIKLCLHLSLTSAGGRLQQQGAPDSRTTSLLLFRVEHS